MEEGQVINTESIKIEEHYSEDEEAYLKNVNKLDDVDIIKHEINDHSNSISISSSININPISEFELHSTTIDKSIENKNVEENDNDSSGVQNLHNQTATTSSSTTKGLRKKAKEDVDFITIAKLLIERKKPKLDDIDYFFMSIAKTCKKFDPMTQAQLKQRFMNIIIQTEMDMNK